VIQKISALEDFSLFIRNGASIKQTDGAKGDPITRIETIANRTVNLTKCGYADVSSEDYEKYLLQEGDILISHINSTKHLGKCAIYEGDEVNIIHGMNLLCLRVDGKKAHAKYVFYMLSSSGFLEQLPKITKNSVNQSSFNVKSFQKLNLPLPPLDTQKKIASVLEKADQLRKDCKQMEQELNSLAQSVFIDMFGDPVNNPKGWVVSTLNLIASVQLGKMLSSKYKQNINPKKYLRNANVQWRTIGIDDLLEMDFNEKEMKKFQLEKGDLLVCEGGEIGRCAIWNEQVQDCYYQKALHRVRVDQQVVTPEYLQEYFFWMAKLGGLVSSTNEVTFKHLTAEKMNKLKVPLAPISKQKEFSKIYLSIQNQLTRNIALMREAEQAFNSLMQKAFKGELNL